MPYLFVHELRGRSRNTGALPAIATPLPVRAPQVSCRPVEHLRHVFDLCYVLKLHWVMAVMCRLILATAGTSAGCHVAAVPRSPSFLPSFPPVSYICNETYVYVDTWQHCLGDINMSSDPSTTKMWTATMATEAIEGAREKAPAPIGMEGRMRGFEMEG